MGESANFVNQSESVESLNELGKAIWFAEQIGQISKSAN